MRTMWNEPLVGERHARRLAGGYQIREWDGEKWADLLRIYKEGRKWVLLSRGSGAWVAHSEEDAMACGLDGSYAKLLQHHPDCCCIACLRGIGV